MISITIITVIISISIIFKSSSASGGTVCVLTADLCCQGSPYQELSGAELLGSPLV